MPNPSTLAMEEEEREKQRKGRFIYTYTGRCIRPCDPSAADINIEDIARALSRLCRYTGHTRHFYSVAQHSVLVSEHVPDDLRLQGLLHDAPEAYLGDISSPLKASLPAYKQYEHQFERVLRGKFGLPVIFDPAVKVADLRALATEWRDLMPEGANIWTTKLEPWTDVSVTDPWDPDEAYLEFIERYWELTDV